jgi:hypothetical protein|tara:strand:- start:1782 stop:2174 length:393 start_codon:yes stop_codon:yes gene_type:complete
MKEIGWVEIVSIIVALIGLVLSLKNLFLRKKLNKQLENKIANSNLEKSIEKMIKIRNSNSHNKKRELTNKEINSLINRLEVISQELNVNERKHFESTWLYKNQRDKLNYLLKLISESSNSRKFERFEKAN